MSIPATASAYYFPKVFSAIMKWSIGTNNLGQRDGFQNLTLKSVDVEKPQAGSVLIKVHAVSLNVRHSIFDSRGLCAEIIIIFGIKYRDIMIAGGTTLVPYVPSRSSPSIINLNGKILA